MIEELLSLDQLRDSWNAQADAMNSWDELGADEIIWWAHPVTLPAMTGFSQYRLIFPNIRADQFMQIDELQLFGSVVA